MPQATASVPTATTMPRRPRTSRSDAAASSASRSAPTTSRTPPYAAKTPPTASRHARAHHAITSPGQPADVRIGGLVRREEALDAKLLQRDVLRGADGGDG